MVADDGHVIRELVGLLSMNVTKYSVAHIVAPAGSVGQTRQNQFDEIMIVIRGEGMAKLDHVTESLHPQDLLLLPSGTRYTIEAGAEADLEMWAICVPAYRPEWSQTGSAKRNWRDYQVPRGSERLRMISERNRNRR